MLKGSVALIGLGAIGVPIAHKLYLSYGDKFSLIASGERKKRLLSEKMTINGDFFTPKIISSGKEMDEPIGLLIICIKNYQLESSIEDIRNVANTNTIILPLQNGIFSYEYFRQEFPNNTILPGFIQGPNTKRTKEGFEYTNQGSMHIGDQAHSILDIAADTYSFLDNAGVQVHLEQDIRRMIWKKWMLNVAGNSVTALTNADYKHFKDSEELRFICKSAMLEFITVAKAEEVHLTKDDITDVLEYYTTYNGSKRTSMLEDICNKRRTENEYIAGKILELAKKHNLNMPVISSLYSLIKVKEWLYLNEED